MIKSLSEVYDDINKELEAAGPQGEIYRTEDLTKDEYYLVHKYRFVCERLKGRTEGLIEAALDLCFNDFFFDDYINNSVH